VHGFDPTPKAISFVHHNVRADRFHLHECAISVADGTLRLYLPRSTDAVSASLVAGKHTREDYIDVPARRLSSLRKEFGTPDFLKMDIEGAEYGVLVDLLTGKDPFFPAQLALEFHHYLPAFGLAATREAVKTLAAAGYRIGWVSPSHHELLFVHDSMATSAALSGR
jgi:FkbM family methyltransferase